MFSFFQDLDDLTEVFGQMSEGICHPKLPLWADLSFQIVRNVGKVTCVREFKKNPPRISPTYTKTTWNYLKQFVCNKS